MGVVKSVTTEIVCTCDRCGDVSKSESNQTFLIDKWREVQINQCAHPGSPLGGHKNYLLCPGCAGMMEHFIGMGA